MKKLVDEQHSPPFLHCGREKKKRSAVATLLDLSPPELHVDTLCAATAMVKRRRKSTCGETRSKGETISSRCSAIKIDHRHSHASFSLFFSSRPPPPISKKNHRTSSTTWASRRARPSSSTWPRPRTGAPGSRSRSGPGAAVVRRVRRAPAAEATTSSRSCSRCIPTGTRLRERSVGELISIQRAFKKRRERGSCGERKRRS